MHYGSKEIRNFYREAKRSKQRFVGATQYYRDKNGQNTLKNC